jgi:heme exporter protein D
MVMVDHLGFIVAAYAITALVLAGLVLWVVTDGRAQRAALADLDRRGARRGTGTRPR